MSGEMTGYSVKEYAVFIQEIQSGCCNVTRNGLQHKRNKNKISPRNWLRSWDCFPYSGKRWILAVENMGGHTFKYPFVYINNKTFEGIDGAKEPRTLLYVGIQEPGTET